jgi:hypothetical protein
MDTYASKQRILILGGGFGGVATARHLEGLLPCNKRFDSTRATSKDDPAAQAAAGRGGPIARRAEVKSAEGVNHE